MSDTTGIPIFCGDCGRDDVVVGKLATSLRCQGCGSGNLGLTGVDPRPNQVSHHAAVMDPGMMIPAAIRHTAAPKGPGTGWGQPHPDPLNGWNMYVGPTPQTMPRTAPVADTDVCPVCHGSGYDLIDKVKCRECGGLGRVTYPTQSSGTHDYDATTHTSPAGGSALASLGLTAEASQALHTAGRPNTKDPYGPEYQNMHGDPNYRSRVSPSIEFDPGNKESFYPSSPNVSPHVKTREDRDYNAPSGPYQMDQAACPNCGHAPTQLVKDKNQDAWWHCPSCGPLANIDRNPEVNPYSPPRDFTPDRGMKTGGFLSRNHRTGRLLAILAKIHEANELTEREAVGLARRTVSQYRDGR